MSDVMKRILLTRKINEQLDKTVNESIKSGAGKESTAELMNTYKKHTPEQSITRFKAYRRTK